MTRPAEQLGLPLKERERRDTNRGRVFSLLSDGAWHSAAELVGVGGLRFGARIHELRHNEERPRVVDCRVEAGASWYRLRLDGWPQDAANANAEGAQ